MRCSLCLITFSIFKSVGVVTSVRVMMGEESADGPVTDPPVGVHVLPRVRSKYDSSVWVALSSCRRVEVSRLQAGAGRKYSASRDAVRRIEPSFSVSTFPADKDKFRGKNMVYYCLMFGILLLEKIMGGIQLNLDMARIGRVNIF